MPSSQPDHRRMRHHFASREQIRCYMFVDGQRPMAGMAIGRGTVAHFRTVWSYPELAIKSLAVSSSSGECLCTSGLTTNGSALGWMCPRRTGGLVATSSVMPHGPRRSGSEGVD